jgi:hypothetical protein
MNPDQQNALSTAMHEYAHYLQRWLPGLNLFFTDLHKRRTARAPLKRLQDITKDMNYRLDELAREDNYIDPYFGKEYGALRPGDKKTRGDPREMMAKALETMLGVDHNTTARQNGLAALKLFYTKDRELFDLTLGLLFHWKP